MERTQVKNRGAWGEEQVANYLRRRGYRILEHSFRCRYGEIDLIAKKGGMLCFVEVKLRSSTAFGLPREFVTAQKQQKLRLTAQYYLSCLGEEIPLRFDVAEVYTDDLCSKKNTRIEYIENAF